MGIDKINKSIYSVGTQHYERRLFDSLIPLPDGTSYNAYVVKGSKKTALIDTADPAKKEEFLNNLKEAEIDKLDYIIANHGEQDHSGLIGEVLEIYPSAQVISSKKCKDLLVEFGLADEEGIKVVEDGDEISLGDKTLQFIEAPWVHWPETILTFLKEDKILFPCDLFGSHLATNKLYADCGDARLYLAAKRYFAEIMMPFSKKIEGYLEKLSDMDIDMIAPSHGPVYKDPDYITDLYKKWVGENTDNTVVLPYISMHGSTKKAVDYLIDALTEKGIEVRPFDLSATDIGELASELVDSATMVVGTPTVLGGAHPVVLNAAYLANALRPNIKNISVVCSYGWGGRAVKQLADTVSNIKADIIEPVTFKGVPNKEAKEELKKLASEISKRHEKLT